MQLSAVQLLALWLSLCSLIHAASLLAIDYGTDGFKASLVKPGVPFDVLLNKDSKRKTPSTVTIRGDERAVGGESASLATRFPQDTLSSVKLLLGHPASHSQAALHQSLFLSSLSDNPRMSTSIASSKATFEVEEVLAMQFAYAKEMAEVVAAESVRDVVVTVPHWFGTSERQAIMDAIELSGLRPLGLLNDGTAAAVNFAMTRTFPATPSYHLIYDFGAGSLRSTVVSLRSALLPDPMSLAAKPELKNVTSLQVHGTGFDLRVGGYVFDAIIRDLLKDAFIKENPALGAKVAGDKRAMAKLLREASRVKQVLSANSESVARIEGLIDDIDFRATITRSELEEAASTRGLLPRFVGPLTQALEIADMKMDQIDSVIMVGGSSRVPMVENAVKELVGVEKLAKNVNADEAAVMGAALYGAAVARGFRTKDIRVQDLTTFGIDVSYEADNDSADDASRIVTTPLFPGASKLGVKKTLTLKKVEDFLLTFSYADGQAKSVAELPYRILSANVSGISSALTNMTSDAIANATIKITVELNESGLIDVERAIVRLPEDTSSSSSGLNGKIKDLLGKLGGSKAEPSLAPESADGDDAKVDEVTGEANDTATRAKLEEMIRVASSTNSTIKLDITATPLEREPLSTEAKSDARKRLREAKAAETRKLARAEAQNLLEAFIYRVRDLVEQSAFVEASLESERKVLKERTEAAAEWLYEEGDSAPTKDLKSKKADLEKLVKHITSRTAEASQRPRAVSALQTILLASEVFVTSARTNDTLAEKAGETPKYTQVELDGLHSLAEETTTWLQEISKEQAKLKIHEDPVLKVADMEKKGKTLDAALNKLKRKKAPKRKKAGSGAPVAQEESGEKDESRVKDEL